MLNRKALCVMIIGVALAWDGDLQAKPTKASPAPFLPVPNAEQLEWQRQEYAMFVHYGLKTYYPSHDHKGSGKDDPKRFNPQHFDATQWVKAAKAGGFKGIVLTAKHHAGVGMIQAMASAGIHWKHP